ncbi:MAG: type I pullulanase [Sodaliphilus sp.]
MKRYFILACMAMVSWFGIKAELYNEMTYTPKATTFNLVAQKAQSVQLNLYTEGVGGKAIKSVAMQKKQDGSWEAVVKGDLKGKFYTFNVTQNGKQLGETPGLFAKAVGVNGKRGAVIDLAATNPEGWGKDKALGYAPTDIIVYESHNRDFSVSRKEARYPGKFMALTEPWAIEHLKNLGITAIHLLPSFDYASVDEEHLERPQFNWGYDPLNYNVPEGSYATDPFKPEVRVSEFKQMVKALHDAGIAVILDVVYNHTMDIEHSNFQRTNPDVFYRKNPDGTYSNGSACSNETASDQPLMRQYMIESFNYWAKEYHLDGFRVDLMGIHDIETMNLIRQSLPKDVFIYGEGWSGGTCAYPIEKLAMKVNTYQMPGIAAFCDDMRDALRGPFNNDHESAFLAAKPGNVESIKAGIVGCIKHPQVDYSKVNYSKAPWTLQPTQMMAYVSCHDDMCLVDRLKASIPGITQDELIRLNFLAQTAVFTSQGVPFMLSGEEMLRDKKGVHNSFNSPDSINQLPWENLQKYPQVMAYYKGLIALRKAHPAFRMGDADLVRKHLEFLPVGEGLVAFHLKDHAGGDAWQDIYVVLNANKYAALVDVPQASYTSVVANGKVDLNGIRTTITSRLEVPAQSALIVHN